ncbi:type II toxin-antitoxin system ParD family antitoxin [Pseudooceanicola nanhaiensis]|uniref:ribbon-helix-helix domain-containing protein n=1 Tax=Pseudooceanicola nanhaiensis TaxID=375761 RepID=UPI001CD7B924|nr:type II toxin-antitoxin system ParD family antitoxin [Pseudooceanicola nanhaiensis]MCA0922508.1 type II toxin-antitoxin system ParD family antitoxin [Pseudooceanicola nanhaiensis]
MSVKSSVSLTDAQDAYARQLVLEGRFPSVSAVVQHGLELMRQESTTTEALRALLEQRRGEPGVSLAQGRREAEEMIARKRAARGL